jgi:biopolymer transport protein ExbD
MKRPKFAPLAPKIPTASMADIAFLLIIFFMLTTSFSPEKTSVTLPQSEIQSELSKDAAIIAISPQGLLSFTDGEQPAFPLATYSDIGPLVAGMIKIFPEKEFLIKADREVRYEMVDSVLEQLRNNGVRRIGLLTDRKVVREI